MAPRPDLGYGRPGIDMGPGGGYDVVGEHPVNISPSAGYDSPFSFHPPALADAQQQQQQQQQQHQQQQSGIISTSQASSTSNPRKRPFPGADGPDDGGDYDYGSESRPQSRRLSLMELCNDTDADAGVGQFIPPSAQGGGGSRPTTSSGLVTSASALALVDRHPHAAAASPSLLARAAQAAAGSAASASAGGGGGGGGSAQEYGGGRVSPASRRVPSSSSPAAAIFSPFRGSYASPTLSDATSSSSSSSPRSSPRSPFGHGGRSTIGALQQSASSPSPSTPDSALPRRGGGGDPQQHDQVRIAVSPHSSAVVGMRV